MISIEASIVQYMVRDRLATVQTRIAEREAASASETGSAWATEP